MYRISLSLAFVAAVLATGTPMAESIVGFTVSEKTMKRNQILVDHQIASSDFGLCSFPEDWYLEGYSDEGRFKYYRGMFVALMKLRRFDEAKSYLEKMELEGLSGVDSLSSRECGCDPNFTAVLIDRWCT